MVNKVDTITIFIIQAYQNVDVSTGTLKDAVTVEVIDETVNGAIARVKKIIKKKHYRVTSIIEKELPRQPIYLSENKHGTN